MSQPLIATELPEGEYAVVECLGHRTMVGRIAEVDRFGTKMLQIEPMFAEFMLDPVFVGGASIYQLTPCSAEIAFNRRPKYPHQLPASVATIVPAAALTTNEELPSFLVDDDDDGFPA